MATYQVDTEDGSSYHVETEDPPSALSQLGTSAMRGIEEGGLGVLQTAENMQKDLTGQSSKFQPIIDQARQYLPKAQGGNFLQNTGNAIAEGAGELPGIVTQVKGLGGGPIGMAAQGFYGQNSDASMKQRLVGAGTGAVLGTAYGGISKIQPTPEAGTGEVVSKLLTRMGLGGLLGSGATAVTRGTPEQIAAQGALGAYQPSETKGYTQQEEQTRASSQGQMGRDLSQQLLGAKSDKGVIGETPDAAEAVYQTLQSGAKNYRDIVGQLKDKASDIGQQASDIIKQNNFPVDPRTALDPLRQAIKTTASQGHQENKVSAMQDVLNEEEAKINKGDIGQDRVSTHSRKQELQDLAAKERAYTKTDDDKTSGRQDAFRALAQGYRSITEGGDQRLSELNGQYGPLVEAQQYANARLDDQIKSGGMYKPWWEKIMHLPYRIGSLVTGGPAAATGIPIETARMAQASSGDVSSLVDKIIKARATEQKLNPSSKSNLSPPMQGQPAYTPPPTRGPGPYAGGASNYAGPEILNQQDLRQNLSQENYQPQQPGNVQQPPPYVPQSASGVGGYAGNASSYQGPEVQQQKPYYPYGESLPYKKPMGKMAKKGR